MNGIMNENQLIIVKKYEIFKPLTHKIDSIIDNCYRDCHYKYFQVEYECIYDINLTNVTNNEIISLTIADQNMNLYEVNRKMNCSTKRLYIYSNKQPNKKSLFTSTIYKDTL